ncbi:MAG: CHASE3 domain-containing protein [Pirellulales bacterium]|nr:CHASE3 domain-containing protein [Pirellulales bacterium]
MPFRGTYIGTRSLNAAILVAVMMLVFIVSFTWMNYQSIVKLSTMQERHAHSIGVSRQLIKLLSTVQDAETGHRGYQITGNETYLAPYLQAIREKDDHINHLRRIGAADVEFLETLQQVAIHVNQKFVEMAHSIEIYEQHGKAAAHNYISNNRGKAEMDAIRLLLAKLETREKQRQHALEGEIALSKAWAWRLYVAAVVIGVGLVFLGFYYLYRDNQIRNKFAQYLQQQDQAKNNFLAMLGHELRNPLATIRNSIDVLELQEELPPELMELKHIMERQTDVIIRLADDLLDASRISHNKLQVTKAPLDLKALLERAVSDTNKADREYGVNLVCDMPAEDVWVEADSARLLQVFGNLLHNAIKFSRRGQEVTIALTCSQADSALIEIRDQGEGMDEATLRLIFDPFAQGPGGTVYKRGGLGLGLALARGLIDLHGGKIAASSPGMGLGSKFQIWLPRIEKPARLPAVAADRRQSQRQCTVVIIDDRRDAAFPLRRMLELMGHTVYVAQSGQAGIDLCQEKRPDLVLCDIGLPEGMSGYDVARFLGKSPETSDIYLVAITGYGQDGARQQALEAGFHQYVTKPISLQGLQTIVGAIPCGTNNLLSGTTN